jgi:hypothetical protein
MQTYAISELASAMDTTSAAPAMSPDTAIAFEAYRSEYLAEQRVLKKDN